MAAEETGPSPKTQSNPSKTTTHISQATDSILSPGFRSVAALAGWDEESLLAGLVVEDTPERDTKHKKRSIFPLKTPPTDSRRKRRARKSGAVSIPVVVLSLDDDDETAKEGPGGVEEKKNEELMESENGEEKAENDSSKALPCMGQLREELSCAICLEICFEPSTTPCGHSFCMKCLKYAATKCGKRCPKCRQLISNGRACTVNTVLWNTIQLLFPKEVDARKAAGSSNRRSDPHGPGTGDGGSGRRRSRTYSTTNRNSGFIMSSELVNMAEAQPSTRSESFRNLRSGTQISRAVESSRSTTRTVRPSQSEDAALALRLQREEFMGSVTETRREVGDRRSSVHSARANLRAMASRAIQIRARSRY